MFESGGNDFTDVREWSGGSQGFAGVVSRLYWMSGSSREALADVREWSGGPP